jgi:hypothetical protein
VRICNIVPIPHLDDLIGEEETHHLVVADKILESDTYTEFYRSRKAKGDYVIMDSMAFESEGGTPLPLMVEAARKLQPSEIVLPDDMSSGERTVKMARVAMSEFRFLGFTRPSFMAVPHGKNIDEYLLVAVALGRIPHVTTLGIQEEVEDDFGVSRLEVCKRVHNATGKQLHMLGATESLNEWRDPEIRRLVRTCDTAKLAVYGFGGHRVRPATKKMPKYPGRSKFGGRIGYFNYSHPVNGDDDQLAVAYDNITEWRELCAREEVPSV